MKSYLNSDLLLELIITNSPTAPCSHVFIAAKLNDNEHKNDKSRNRFICKYCLTHLFITGTESSRCKNHMFLTDASNDLSHIHSVCVHCQLSFQIATQLRQFPENLLSDLLFRKDVESQIYCLFMLIFYFGAIYNGASKPINSKNPKFLQYIGTGQVPIDALGLIGYSLDAQGYFQPSKVASADRDKIECIIEELSLIRTTFKDDGSNSEMFLRAFRDELRHLPTAYRLLGCSSPAGLTNIGNTCYLNSLLQYYFSINPLRDFVLRFGEVDLGVAQAKIEDRKVRSQYCKTKLEFTIVVLQLQNLFIELIKSNDMEVKPSRTLAEVLLKANSSGVFGEQQDIHECMDSFLDMIQIMVDQSNLELDLNKTKQTLAYKDPDGVEKLLLKEETFHQIIVNVFPCLYDGLIFIINSSALDEYFGDQTVDFERGKALKCLGVLEFPTALAIRINRVVYDRDTQKVVKTNHYLKYPKKLYMDRYMYVNANETKQKQLHIKAIDTEIKGLKIALDELQNQLLETMLKITSLTNSKLQMFEDMNTEEYMLYGAFFHQGDANFGHYWQFLYDVHQKRWLKFNDSLVTEVPESQVFEDTTGKTYNTYTLIYIKSGQLETLTRPMVRTEELRKYYFNSGNK
ncbi:ubiquitin-specific protease ubp2 [Globomyces sp. JEL0801]|nr:ubiquitin-specific protease ubp2 [Globomyces sp. JEL0801]